MIQLTLTGRYRNENGRIYRCGHAGCEFCRSFRSDRYAILTPVCNWPTFLHERQRVHRRSPCQCCGCLHHRRCHSH